MPFKISTFVFWSGVYNAGLALLLLFPPLYRAVGLNICTPICGWLLAGFLAYTCVALVYASRDLPRLATLVYWEALLRFITAFILIPAGLLGDIGRIAAIMGVGDIMIGFAYIFGLRREFGLSHRELLRVLTG